jgi:para-aminobenzoate synthetase/4-amino-4-deoxychorismate lyase
MLERGFPGWKAPFVLLDDGRKGEGALLFEGAVQIIICRDPSKVDDSFVEITRGIDAGYHAVLALSYELGHVFEPTLGPIPGIRKFPLIWCGLFHAPTSLAQQDVEQLFEKLAPPPPITNVVLGHDRESHRRCVRQILNKIAAGDIYQANLTFPIDFRYDGDPVALYSILRKKQPVAFGGIIAMDDATTVLSVSPELFFRINDARIEARPMKGTAPRAPTLEGDADAGRNLFENPKQRAENLMIVDLLRNDLARISKQGSVIVPALFTLETYPTFHALTSTVRAELRADTSFVQVLRALFPCGSIVGAPKIRAGQILAEIETNDRGLYTGAIGFIAPNGTTCLNVAIRTAVIKSTGEGYFGVGGGIVADSDPDAEFEEALLKAKVLLDLAEDVIEP